MLKFPNIDLTKKYPSQQAEIRAIESYLFQLVEELRFRLGDDTPDGNNETDSGETTRQDTVADEATVKSVVELSRTSNLILNITDISDVKNIALRTVRARYGDRSTLTVTLDETTGLLDVNTSGLFRISGIVSATAPDNSTTTRLSLNAIDNNGSRELLYARRPNGSTNPCSTSLGSTVAYLYAGTKLALTLTGKTAGQYTVFGRETKLLIEQIY